MIPAADWLPHVSATVAEGFAYVDLLTAVDRGSDGFEIVLRLVRPDDREEAWHRALVDRSEPAIDSITPVLPAASWHEREIHEMFGVDFRGHPDLRPLLLTGSTAYPLRKETPLVARLDAPWPGAADQPTKRRPSLPPGVSAEWSRS